MKSGNPVLRESVFQGVSFRQGDSGSSAVVSAPMTVQGTMAKTALLLLAATVALLIYVSRAATARVAAARHRKPAAGAMAEATEESSACLSARMASP